MLSLLLSYSEIKRQSICIHSPHSGLKIWGWGFPFTAPWAWNQLPDHLQSCVDFAQFQITTKNLPVLLGGCDFEEAMRWYTPSGVSHCVLSSKYNIRRYENKRFCNSFFQLNQLFLAGWSSDIFDETFNVAVGLWIVQCCYLCFMPNLNRKSWNSLQQNCSPLSALHT